MNRVKNGNRYSRETLLPMNTRYDHEYRLTQEDVDAANELARHIECTRSLLIPKIGDRVRYTTSHGDFYGDALIAAVRDDGSLSICLCPFVPFVWAKTDGIGCSVSGGPFTDVKRQTLEPCGTTQGAFKDWGHCGACAHGTFCFEAEVPLWECRESDPLYGDFTTENWRRLYVHRTRLLDGTDYYECDGWGIGREAAFQTFIRDFEATVYDGNSPNQLVVWCYRDEEKALSQKEWETLDAPVTERRIYNLPQPVKLVKDHARHTTICYFVRDVFPQS